MPLGMGRMEQNMSTLDHLRAATRDLAPSLRAVAIACPAGAHTEALRAAADRCEADPSRDTARAARRAAYATLEHVETHHAQPGAHAVADHIERACGACCAAWTRYADGWLTASAQEIRRAHRYANSSQVRAWLADVVPA